MERSPVAGRSSKRCRCCGKLLGGSSRSETQNHHGTRPLLSQDRRTIRCSRQNLHTSVPSRSSIHSSQKVPATQTFIKRCLDKRGVRTGGSCIAVQRCETLTPYDVDTHATRKHGAERENPTRKAALGATALPGPAQIPQRNGDRSRVAAAGRSGGNGSGCLMVRGFPCSHGEVPEMHDPAGVFNATDAALDTGSEVCAVRPSPR